MAVHEMEGYDEVFRRFLELLSPEDIARALTPEQRLAGLAPEQRLAGLAPEQVVQTLGPTEILPAMPDDVLRALGEDFVEQLPEPTRSIVRARRRR